MAKLNFEEITLRSRITSRGGGIEISLDTAGKKYAGHKMTAYQNYLGGGLLGRVCNDCTVPDWRSNNRLVKIANDLAEYFHSLTNPDSEWESMTFEKNQHMPVSAY